MSDLHLGKDPSRLARIDECVRRGETLDERWPGGLHLYIEQPQPVLYVHRETPDDDVTASLLGGQTSVLIGRAAERGTPIDGMLHDLCSTVLSGLVDRFGCALLVELWTAAEDDDETACDLRLVAPQRGAPDRTMEVLERSLARSRLNHQPWRLALRVADSVAPPGQAPLGSADPSMDPSSDASTKMWTLGLAVRPHWRGPDGETRYLKTLRDMRRGLGQALKEAGYEFALHHARVGAPHYHALGRGLATERALEADRAICEIGECYSLLLDVTPVNVSAAYAAFAASHASRAPEFHYRPLAMDPAALKRRLYGINIDPVEDPALHDLLSDKRQEIDREITLLDDRCDSRFLADSLGLFGGVDPELHRLALAVLEQLPPETGDPSPTRTRETFCERAEAEIDWLRAQDPTLLCRVERRRDTTGVWVSEGNVLVGPDVVMSEDRIEALVQHEVGTHVVTRHNGSSQPLHQLKTGMAGYEETQEGMAVLAEYLVGGLSRERLRSLAARVVAVEALIDRAEFVDVVRLLSREHGLSLGGAFTIAMRVFRGGGLTKDAVYLRGLARVLDVLACGTELSDLLVGKISLGAWPIVEELRWRGIVVPPRVQPRYLGDPEARMRLDRIAQGLSVRQIAEELA